jgi:hypothetical protein
MVDGMAEDQALDRTCAALARTGAPAAPIERGQRGS